MSQKSNSYVAIFLTTKKKKSQDACYFFHCYIIEYLVKKVRYMEIKYEREKLIVEGIIHSFFFQKRVTAADQTCIQSVQHLCLHFFHMLKLLRDARAHKQSISTFCSG